MMLDAVRVNTDGPHPSFECTFLRGRVKNHTVSGFPLDQPRSLAWTHIDILHSLPRAFLGWQGANLSLQQQVCWPKEIIF